MTSHQRTVVQRELRAIKRAIARIEETFKGVGPLLKRAQRTPARKSKRRVRRVLGTS